MVSLEQALAGAEEYYRSGDSKPAKLESRKK
jgi:hypothetical protein